MVHLEVLEVLVEGVALVQQLRVLGEEQENYARYQYVEAALLALVVLDVAVRLAERVVELAHHLAGLHRQLLLALQAAVLLASEERQAVVLVGQLVERDGLVAGLGVLAVEVVDADLVEVACDDPLGHDRARRDVVCVPLGLLEGGHPADVPTPVLSALLGLI